MPIIDTHAHLDKLENLEQALQNAREADVMAIMCISMDLASSKNVLAIGERVTSPKIYCALGMHPSETNEDDLDELIALIRDNRDRLNAVGEIGLDFWYKWVRKDDDKKNAQRRVYRSLLAVAKELDLPAVIHSRGAWKECFETAQELNITRALFHWYSGPLDILERIIAAGYYVSTSPSVAYAEPSREAMKAAPIEKTLIETDCPVFYRNRDTGEEFQAEPKDVVRTLEAYAALKGIDSQQAREILNCNAVEFFRLSEI